MDAGIKPDPAAGFSLLELIVVVTVLAILTVSVGLSLSFGRAGRQNGDDVARLQTYFAQLQASAIYSQRPYGMVITARGWQVAHYDGQNGTWDLQGHEFRWIGAASFTPHHPVFDGKPGPEVVFLPDGHSSGFDITLSHQGNYTRCHNDGWTGVLCDPS